VEKWEHLHTVGGNADWHSCYGKEYGHSKKLKLELPYDPAIQLLDIHAID